MVEFALVLPVLLLIVVGMLQFGIILNAKIDETHLASSAARYAAVDQLPDPGSPLQDYIKTKADTKAMRDNAKVCIEHLTNPDTGTAGEVGDPVRVTMSYDYDLIPFLGNALTPRIATLPVAGEATMRLEALPADVGEGCSA